MSRHLGDREIPIIYTSVLLTETARASLHAGLPSASLMRIIAGFEMFTTTSPDRSAEDIVWVQECSRQLRNIAGFWRQKELELFGRKGEQKP